MLLNTRYTKANCIFTYQQQSVRKLDFFQRYNSRYLGVNLPEDVQNFGGDDYEALLRDMKERLSKW